MLALLQGLIACRDAGWLLGGECEIERTSQRVYV
jgi:hypothetical protein